MAIDKKKVKTLIGIGGVALGAAFVGMEALAKKKKRNSVYDNEPEQKNPLEGKKVVLSRMKMIRKMQMVQEDIWKLLVILIISRDLW